MCKMSRRFFSEFIPDATEKRECFFALPHFTGKLVASEIFAQSFSVVEQDTAYDADEHARAQGLHVYKRLPRGIDTQLLETDDLNRGIFRALKKSDSIMKQPHFIAWHTASFWCNERKNIPLL